MDKFLDFVFRESPSMYCRLVDEEGQLTFLGCVALVQFYLCCEKVMRDAHVVDTWCGGTKDEWRELYEDFSNEDID